MNIFKRLFTLGPKPAQTCSSPPAPSPPQTARSLFAILGISETDVPRVDAALGEFLKKYPNSFSREDAGLTFHAACCVLDVIMKADDSTQLAIMNRELGVILKRYGLTLA
jgi:hypothetical protein